jgi:hypothetical protein
MYNNCNYTINTKAWQLIFYVERLKASVSKPNTNCITNEHLRRFVYCNILSIKIVKQWHCVDMHREEVLGFSQLSKKGTGDRRWPFLKLNLK